MHSDRPIFYENLALSNRPFWEEWQSVFNRTLEQGQFILGESVAHFEEAFAQYCGVDYALGVNSGLDALRLALTALDLPPQSEVIIPAHTFMATALSVIQAGHVPVLAEVQSHDYTIDPQEIEKKISPRSKAIVPVHIYGRMANMERINELAQQYKLWVIEDAAQAHGALLKKRKAGAWGDLASFSFYPSKNLGALGDGGAVLTRHEFLYQRIKRLRNYGSEEKYVFEEMGFNSRLDSLQAAFLEVKLKHLEQINQHKRQLAQFYQNHLEPEYNFVLPQVGYEDVYHIFAIRHPQRDILKQYLLSKGIESAVHYPIPFFRQKALRDLFKPQEYPLSEALSQTQLSLPISFAHSQEDIARVVEALNHFHSK